MGQRITQKDLEILANTLNETTENPLLQRANGKANIGNYHLYYAYGSVALHQTTNEGGGVRDVIGLSTKKELYNRMQSYLAGIEAGR